jgi:hypothetical protein
MQFSQSQVTGMMYSIYNAGHGFHDLCSVIFHTEETKIKNIAQKTWTFLTREGIAYNLYTQVIRKSYLILQLGQGSFMDLLTGPMGDEVWPYYLVRKLNLYIPHIATILLSTKNYLKL